MGDNEKKLREALEFYASGKHFRQIEDDWNEDYDITLDRGETAREALAATAEQAAQNSTVSRTLAADTSGHRTAENSTQSEKSSQETAEATPRVETSSPDDVDYLLLKEICEEADDVRASSMSYRLKHKEAMENPHMDALDRLRAAQQKPDGWQPMETAPKGIEILVYRPDAPIFYGVGRIGFDYWMKNADGTGNGDGWAKSSKDAQPTHWMPLPQPPKDSK